MTARTAWRLVLAALVAALLVAIGAHFAFEKLRGAIEVSLGPRATIGTLRASWTGVEALDLRVRAERGAWPAEDELRARRVLLTPSLASLWQRGWHIRRIVVEDAYVSALRTRGGSLRLLPSLLDRPKTGEAPADAATPPIRIGDLRLSGAALDFHDASVRQPPHRVRLERLDASLGPIVLPSLDEAMSIEIDGVLRGASRSGAKDGLLKIEGRVTPATRDASLTIGMADVDLVALQPYLLKLAEGGVKRGRLDLAVQAKVLHNRLHAPGTVTLRDLELNSGAGLIDTFAGVPRQAVLGAMSRDGRIELKFTLDGRLDDPAFSLNENFATRIASGLAETLGVSLGGVVQGVGNVIKGLFGR